MSKSKSKTTSNQTTNQTATTTPNTPDFIEQPWRQYMNQVSGLMNSGQPIVAGPSDLQQQAFQGAQGLTTSPLYGQAADFATQAAGAGANTAGPAALASGRNFTDVDLSGYMNTGLNDLIGASQADYDATGGRIRAAQAAQAALNGGARNSNNAIMSALTEGELSRAANTGLSQLRYDAFNTAAGLAGNDLNREASLSQFNAGQQNQMNQFNASQQDQALARMLQGAGLLGNLGQAQGADERSNLGLQAGLGEMQRGIDNASGEAGNLAALQALLSGVPLQAFVGQTSTGSSNSTGNQTTTNTPSLLSQIGQGASTAASLASLFSDERLKADIVPVRKDKRGRQWYQYRYVWDAPGTIHEGVMAQEIMDSDPQAVTVHDSGFLMVDYLQLEAA